MLNYVNTTVSVSDLATQVQQELSSRMMARASGLLNTPPLVADMSAATVALNLFTPTNFSSTRAAAWEYFRTVPSLSFLTFSTLSNTYFGYERTVNDSINLYGKKNVFNRVLGIAETISQVIPQVPMVSVWPGKSTRLLVCLEAIGAILPIVPIHHLPEIGLSTLLTVVPRIGVKSIPSLPVLWV